MRQRHRDVLVGGWIRFLLGSALGLLLVSSPPVHAAAYSGSFEIIVNSQNPVGAMSHEQASLVFLKKMPSWPNGVWVEPVDQHPASEIREDFTRRIHGKSVSAVRSYWQRVIFSGLATPAHTRKSDQEVVKFVAKHVGAIGYVSVGTPLDGNVKVIRLTD